MDTLKSIIFVFLLLFLSVFYGCNFVLGGDETGGERVTSAKGRSSGILLSPDRKLLVYEIGSYGYDDPGIYVYDISSEAIRKIGFDKEVVDIDILKDWDSLDMDDLQWSTNSKYIVFRDHKYGFFADVTQEFPVFYTFDISQPFQEELLPSPFDTRRHTEPQRFIEKGISQTKSSIYDTRDNRTILYQKSRIFRGAPVRIYDINVSPNNKYIAYTISAQGGVLGSDSSGYVASIDTGKNFLLADPVSGKIQWNEDGSSVFAIARQDGGGDSYIFKWKIEDMGI